MTEEQLPEQKKTEEIPGQKKKITWVVSNGFLVIIGYSLLQTAYILSDVVFKLILATIGLSCVFIGITALFFAVRKEYKKHREKEEM